MPFRAHRNYRNDWSSHGFVIAGVVITVGLLKLQPVIKWLLLYFFGAE